MSPLIRSVHVSTLFAGLAFAAAIIGSQWGMIILSYVYATQGRASLAVSPELFAGVVAGGFALVAFTVRGVSASAVKPALLVSLPLVAFALVGIVNELLRQEVHWRSITSFTSLVLYLAAGIICGYCLLDRYLNQVISALLVIFAGWYLGLAMLAAGGLLRYEQLLTAFGVPRLEVAGGFTATEIPIYIGQQLPFLLVVLLGPFSHAQKIASGLLLGGVTAVLFLTASAGALVAACIVLGIFVAFGSGKAKLRALLVLLLLGGALVLDGGIFLFSLYESIVWKMEVLEGGGGRAATIATLQSVAMENFWSGVGLGQFQHMNSLGWYDEGIYPHNNILGIAAEIGTPAAILYGVFVLTAIWCLVSGILRCKREKQETAALMLTAILSVLVYQQSRGMLHDTWSVKELYFWVGIGTGVLMLRATARSRATRSLSSQRALEQLSGTGASA